MSWPTRRRKGLALEVEPLIDHEQLEALGRGDFGEPLEAAIEHGVLFQLTMKPSIPARFAPDLLAHDVAVITRVAPSPQVRLGSVPRPALNQM